MHLIASEELFHPAPEDVVELALCRVILILDSIIASRAATQLPYIEALQDKPASIFS